MARDERPLRRVNRTHEQARINYDGLSRCYDVLAGSVERRYRNAGLHMLAAEAGECVLEVGFGTGEALQTLAEAVGPAGVLHGIDISQGMLEVSRAKLQHACLANRVVLQQGDAVQLPYSNCCFDALFMSFTLELFDTPEIPIVLAECRRVLRPQGRICVVAMSRRSADHPMTRLYEWLHDRFPRRLDCRPIPVRQCLEEAGLRTVELRRMSMFGLAVDILLSRRH